MQPPKLSTHFDSTSSTEETPVTSTTQQREAQQHELQHTYYHTNRRPHRPHVSTRPLLPLLTFPTITQEYLNLP